MKKVLASLFFLFETAYGLTLGEPGGLAISAEWIFVSAAIDQPYFVIQSNANDVTNGERFSNEQGWHQGYRIETYYRFGNGLTNLSLRWTHLPKFTDHTTVSGDNLYGVFTSPQATLAGANGEATLRDSFNVFTLDLLLGQTLFDLSNFQLAFQGGIQYGYASFFEESIFTTDEIGGILPRIIRNKSRVSGWGPALGIEFAFRVYKWLGIAGRVSGAFLISDRKASLFDNGTLAPPDQLVTEVTNSNYRMIVPTSTARLGLTFRNPLDLRKWFDCSPLASFGCLNLDLEIGYEVISFYKAVDRIFFVDDVNTGISTDELMDLTFHGPYIHLGLSF